MKKLLNLPFWLLSIAVPFLLIMASIRILLIPIFLDYEYNLKNFPEDEFGFSTADRLHWGKISLDYLTNAEGISFLGDLRFSDGQPLYNQRELSHMLDVKVLVRSALIVWYCLLVLILILLVVAWKKKATQRFFRAVASGGWVTIGLILAILAAILINFDALFRGFHAIFFVGDTWLFYTSDTLIRLFPEKLWSDGFTFMGVFTLAGAVVCAFVLPRFITREKKEPA
jgi:integral membrane protein (TIGR01906 family)